MTTSSSITPPPSPTLYQALLLLPAPPQLQRLAALLFSLYLFLFCSTKLWLFARGIIFMVASNEKKGMKKAPDAGRVDLAGPSSGRRRKQKTVVFIRHGESEWNLIFNKSKLLLLPRLILGLVRELLRCRQADDSVLIDSPLSATGEGQAAALQGFVASYRPKGRFPDNIVSCLRGEEGAATTVLVSSNLRRALQTGIIALWPRLVRGAREEAAAGASSGARGQSGRHRRKICVLSSLQEMSRNVDTNALATRGKLPTIPGLKKLREWAATGSKQSSSSSSSSASNSSSSSSNNNNNKPLLGPMDVVDPSLSTGNKRLNSRGLQRMEQFAAWCMDQPEDVIVVAAGHSLWFKNFFKVFLPRGEAAAVPGAGSSSPSSSSSAYASISREGRRLADVVRNRKMKNCAAVSFTLVEGSDTHTGGLPGGPGGYCVDADSLGAVYGGFEKVSGGARGAGAGPTADVIQRPGGPGGPGGLAADDTASTSRSSSSSSSSSSSNVGNNRPLPLRLRLPSDYSSAANNDDNTPRSSPSSSSFSSEFSEDARDLRTMRDVLTGWHYRLDERTGEKVWVPDPNAINTTTSTTGGAAVVARRAIAAGGGSDILRTPRAPNGSGVGGTPTSAAAMDAEWEREKEEEAAAAAQDAAEAAAEARAVAEAEAAGEPEVCYGYRVMRPSEKQAAAKLRARLIKREPSLFKEQQAYHQYQQQRRRQQQQQQQDAAGAQVTMNGGTGSSSSSSSSSSTSSMSSSRSMSSSSSAAHFTSALDPAMGLSDATMVRFLRANRGPLPNLVATSANTSCRVDLCGEGRALPPVVAFFRTGGFCGRDREGNPIFYDRPGRMDVDGLLRHATPEDLLLNRIHRAEEATEVLDAISTPARVYAQITVVMDLKGLGWMHVRPKSLSMLRRSQGVSSANYPERMKRMLIINAPKTFAYTWRIISSFIKERTRHKIRILREGDPATLDHLLDIVPSLDDLPAFLGGTLESPPGDPDCGALIQPGGPVPTNKKELAAALDRRSCLEADIEEAGEGAGGAAGGAAGGGGGGGGNARRSRILLPGTALKGCIGARLDPRGIGR
eukprot:g730.t1